MRSQQTRRGFTLIELLIYVGVFSIAAGLFTGVLTTLTRVQVRESATTEVSQQAQFVVQTVQRLIRDASIVELAANTPVSTLKLRMSSTSKDPTCVDLSGGVARIMEGSGATAGACNTSAAAALTDSKVVVNTLNFTKLSNPPAKDTVQIDITVSYNSTNPQESSISRTLRSAITKVSAATFDADIVPASDNAYRVGIGANRWIDGAFSQSVGIGVTTIPPTPSGIALDIAQNKTIRMGQAYLSSGGNLANLANNEWYNGTSWQATAAGWLIQASGGAATNDGVYIYYHDAAGSHTEAVRFATSSGAISTTFGGGTGKINVGTIDPIYNIGGTRYATYMSAVAGTVREEAVGTVTLRNREATIDFDEVARGSDLWIFYQITDFGPRWDNLVVQLTPNTNGTVWYEKDVLRNRLVIKGEKGGEVSFRLSAPRFDHDKWGNVSDTQNGGFEVREKQ